eukprot:1376836-Amorphochlora_amoeboformis.AAC.2
MFNLQLRAMGFFGRGFGREISSSSLSPSLPTFPAPPYDVPSTIPLPSAFVELELRLARSTRPFKNTDRYLSVRDTALINSSQLATISVLDLRRSGRSTALCGMRTADVSMEEIDYAPARDAIAMGAKQLRVGVRAIGTSEGQFFAEPLIEREEQGVVCL